MANNEITIIKGMAKKLFVENLYVASNLVITPEQMEYIQDKATTDEDVKNFLSELYVPRLGTTKPVEVLTKSNKKMFLLREGADALKEYVITHDLLSGKTYE